MSMIILHDYFGGIHLTNTFTYWCGQHRSKAGPKHEEGEPKESLCGRHLKMLLHIWDAGCVDGRAKSAGSISMSSEMKTFREDASYIVKAHVAGIRA